MNDIILSASYTINLILAHNDTVYNNANKTYT